MYNHAMSSSLTMVCFSGLAADRRLYERQACLPWSMQFIDWDDPQEDEPLQEYALRLAKGIEWPERAVLCGISMGGMVAAELSQHLRAEAVVMIASTMRPQNITSLLRTLNVISGIIPDLAVRKAGDHTKTFLNLFHDFTDAEHELFADMFRQTPVARVKRLGKMIFDWPGVEAVPCPRLHIHGERDPIIPVRKAVPAPDVIIPGARHLVNWTHADDVNEAIRSFLTTIEGE